jgi:hypothetical protein
VHAEAAAGWNSSLPRRHRLADRDVEPVPDIDICNIDQQSGEGFLIVVAGGLFPNLIRQLVQRTESVVVNGAPGVVSWRPDGTPMAVLGFVVATGRIVEIYVVSNPERVQQLITYRPKTQ